MRHFRRLALTGIMAIGACVSGIAHARQSCLSDAEIEQRFGGQIRAGTVTLDTAGYNDRPLCSGLTLASAIQKLRDQAFPEEKRALIAENEVMRQAEEMERAADLANGTSGYSNYPAYPMPVETRTRRMIVVTPGGFDIGSDRMVDRMTSGHTRPIIVATENEDGSRERTYVTVVGD